MRKISSFVVIYLRPFLLMSLCNTGDPTFKTALHMQMVMRCSTGLNQWVSSYGNDKINKKNFKYKQN